MINTRYEKWADFTLRRCLPKTAFEPDCNERETRQGWW